MRASWGGCGRVTQFNAVGIFHARARSSTGTARRTIFRIVGDALRRVPRNLAGKGWWRATVGDEVHHYRRRRIAASKVRRGADDFRQMAADGVQAARTGSRGAEKLSPVEAYLMSQPGRTGRRSSCSRTTWSSGAITCSDLNACSLGTLAGSYRRQGRFRARVRRHGGAEDQNHREIKRG